MVNECVRRGIPVAPTYGLTEASSQVATMRPEDAAARPSSAGRPLLPVECVSSAKTAPSVPRTRRARCPARADADGGLLTAVQTRRRRALRGGWFHTGDFGYQDAAGYLYVVDRRDDIIVTGGENVYPAEVEQAIETHPSVAEAGVFAQTDTLWGQSVTAAVSLREGASLTAEELQDYCRTWLAGYKVPRAVFITGPLPRNASGKLLRRELRASLEGAALRTRLSSVGAHLHVHP